MNIVNLFNDGPIPVLAATVQFAARRQDVIAHNISNLSTPRFTPHDVSTSNFQEALGNAIDRRRQQFGASRGEFKPVSTDEVEFGTDGRLALTPRTSTGNILFHDQSDRDLERQMQALAENTAVFRISVDLLKGRMDLLNTAIRERV